MWRISFSWFSFIWREESGVWPTLYAYQRVEKWLKAGCFCRWKPLLPVHFEVHRAKEFRGQVREASG